MAKIPDIKFREDKANEIGFEIMTLQSLLDRSESLVFPINQLHSIRFHQLMLICKGNGSHVVDFENYKLSVGDLLFVNMGQVHAFAEEGKRDGYVILFTDEFLNKNLSQSDYLAFYRFFALSQYPPIISFNNSELMNLMPVIHGMEREFNREDNFAKLDIVRSLLKILLLSAERIARHSIKQPQTAEFKTFVAFQKLLSKEYTQTRDAKKYAISLNISYRHLNDVCKEFTQRTAKIVIDDFVTLEAKRKLSQVDLPIKEISYFLGFDEPTNFVKYFKKQIGISPKMFREQLSE